MTFEWHNIELLESFATFTTEPQEGLKRQFFIDVDPSNLEEEELFEFSLVASDSVEDAEFYYSIEVFKPEEVVEETDA